MTGKHSDNWPTGWAGLNVLVVSPTPTHPVDFGNRRRISVLCSRLRAMGANIHFIHYPAESDWRERIPESEDEMRTAWDSYYLAPVTRPLHTPPASEYHEADEWWDDSIGNMVSYISDKRKIDVIIVNYTWLSRAFEYVPKHVIKILDTHDKFSGRKEMLAQHGIAPEYFYMTQTEEKKAIARADIVWAIKGEEEQYFRELGAQHVDTVLHAEPVAVRRRKSRSRFIRFGVTGARNSINEANLRKFLGELNEYLKHTLLPCEVVIAGSCCDLLTDLSYPFVRMMGRVDSMDEFYSAVDVVLAPMEFSTGLKIKVGEALGYGKALISHVHAFEGYVPTHRMHTLPSYTAMIGAMRDIVKENSFVAELETAAVLSLLAANEKVQCALQATVDAIFRLRKGVYIVVDFKDIRPNSFIFEHVLEAAEYIAHQKDVIFFLVGVPTASTSPDEMSKLRRFGTFVIQYSTTSQVSATDRRRLGIGVSPDATLEQVLAGPASAIWLASMPSYASTSSYRERPTNEAPIQIFIPLGILRVHHSPAVIADIIQRLNKSHHKINLLDPPNSSLSGLVNSRGQYESMVVPMLWRAHRSDVVHIIRNNDRNTVAILVDPERPRVFQLVLQQIRMLCERRVLAVFHDGSEISPEFFSISDPATEYLTTQDFVSYCKAEGSSPQVVFDCGSPDRFSHLKEVIIRANIPILEVFSRGLCSSVNVHEDYERHWAVTTYESLELVRLALLGSSGVAKVAETGVSEEPFARDAGWAIIWRKIKSCS